MFYEIFGPCSFGSQLFAGIDKMRADCEKVVSRPDDENVDGCAENGGHY